jgi:hypothetical protein
VFYRTCRRTTAVAQHDLDSNNTKKLFKKPFLFFFKNVSKNINLYYFFLKIFGGFNCKTPAVAQHDLDSNNTKKLF